jgi:hypothetical protein
MTSQVLQNNEKAVKAIRKAYKEKKISRDKAMWLMSGVKI